jgi:UPF0042 nucleotide-binding protein
LRRDRSGAKVLVITGQSGAGKTHVLRALEDSGWFCVDNLPSALFPPFLELIGRAPELRHSALGVDIRGRDFLERFPRVWRALKERAASAYLLFVEAQEKVLLRRFSETRRPHPLAVNQPVLESIREEGAALQPIRRLADGVLDTSDWNVHELRERIRERWDLRQRPRTLVATVTSFGFRNGVPPEADLVFDVRFLKNPNFVPALKKLSGRDAAVARYLRRQKDTLAFLRHARAFLEFLLPRYIQEGKSYLTIAVGCTGGRHRSVWVAEALARGLRQREVSVMLRHRDLKLQ